MNRNYWRSSIAILWLALPAIALRYWLVWDRLPLHVATHFNAAGQVNGWMSREGSLRFALIFMTLLLTVATILLARISQPDVSSWALLGLFYAVIGVIAYVDNGLLDYNLYRTPIRLLPVMIPIAVVFVTVVILTFARRGTRLPSHNVLAEEEHASLMWGVVLAAPAVAELVAAANIHDTPIRIVLMATGVVLLGAAIMAWSGFHYFFSHAGVEIRVLGFRLRSIPASEIREYAIGRWSMAGGYGIRGIGNKRAYVWGNTGVRIQTGNEEVFLGSSRPERIIHHLDFIRQSGH